MFSIWVVGGLLLMISMMPVSAATQIDNSNSLFVADTDTSYDGGAEWVQLIGTADQQQDAVINVVKGAVNWVLGILALIALLIVLWWWFQMVTSAGNDDQYGKGFTILKYAATGLLLIWVAWFIISMVFWLVSQITNNPWPADSQL